LDQAQESAVGSVRRKAEEDRAKQGNHVAKLRDLRGNFIQDRRAGRASQFCFVRTNFVLALSSVSTVQAQVTVDASKITCDQFVHSKVAPTRTVAAWLSGFYSGKRDNQVIDLQNFEANLSKLENFCYEEKNYKLPVMQAIEKVIGRGK
jgi:acid stress chaperone HdeB